MLANHAKEYVNVLCSVILENALKQEHDYKTFQWADLMSWLKSESKRNSYPEPQAAYQIAYARPRARTGSRGPWTGASRKPSTSTGMKTMP